ncbi:unnamed protein product, partial [marine sediment metagenome]
MRLGGIRPGKGLSLLQVTICYPSTFRESWGWFHFSRLHELRSLFPTGYHRGVCKIAGINYQFMYEHNYWLTYETAPPAKPRYKLDPLGFLENFEEWDEDFARLAIKEL